MLNEHKRATASVNYLANYLSDLHYKYGFRHLIDIEIRYLQALTFIGHVFIYLFFDLVHIGPSTIVRNMPKPTQIIWKKGLTAMRV